MVNCPLFLKKSTKGFSLLELLVVLAILGIVMVALFVVLNPQTQLAKSRDARRKADLKQLQNILEDYYNDKKCYPATLACGASLEPYLNKIPCDPANKTVSYGYTADCSSYRIYAKLEYASDSEITRVGCEAGCGPAGSTAYNYGVSSSNVRLEASTETSTPTPTPTSVTGTWFACQGVFCNNYGSSPPTCTGGGTAYFEDPTCGGGCTPQKCCTDCGGL